MDQISKEELKKVPYISNVPSDGRTVFLQPHFNKEDETFKMFIPKGDKLTCVWAEPAESCYYAEEIIDESKDIYLPLIDIVAQHYSFNRVLKTLLQIIQDIINCSVVIEKYFIILGHYRTSKDLSTSHLIATELEYLFGNVRSLYDLLQVIILELWKKDTGKELPESFAKMVEKKPEVLKEKYSLPDPLIKYYVDSADFFLKCRKIRDGITHRGFGTQIIFCTEDGFALQKDSPIFPDRVVSEFDIWPEDKVKKNGLVSVLALISYINIQVLKNLDAFSQALIKSIEPPSRISESHKIFLRGSYIPHILKADEYLDKQWIQLPERLNEH